MLSAQTQRKEVGMPLLLNIHNDQNAILKQFASMSSNSPIYHNDKFKRRKTKNLHNVKKSHSVITFVDQYTLLALRVNSVRTHRLV